jgi:hypothetical protein
VLLSYAQPAFKAVPYLWLNGPPNSGKSQVLGLLNLLAFRPILAGNISPSALYRTLHHCGGTLLLDEFELSSGEDAESRTTILNCGYSQATGHVVLNQPSGKSDWQPIRMRCFGLKALASVGQIPPTLVSRAICLKMMRTRRKQPHIDEEDAKWDEARHLCYSFALDNGPRWLALAKESPEHLVGRAAQLWGPIMGLARWLDDEQKGACCFFDLIVDLSRQVSAVDPQESFTESETLVLASAAALAREGNDFRCSDVVDSAKAADLTVAKGLTPRRVSNILRKLSLRIHRGHHKVYKCEEVLERLGTVGRTYGEDFGLDDSNP